jgi:hypothetical protein
MLAARLMTSRIARASQPARRATATAVPMVPHVPCECTLPRATVAPPMRDETSYPATSASSSRAPSTPRSSATASAPGTTWIAGWPPPQRLPSSTSSATPAAALTKVARSGSVRPSWPIRVAAGRVARSAIARARRAFSGSALPASIAPSVSSSTSRAADAAPAERRA